MSRDDDFDPAVFGGLLADDEIDPATAFAAAMPDRGDEQRSHWPEVVGLIAALFVMLLWWLL